MTARVRAAAVWLLSVGMLAGTVVFVGLSAGVDAGPVVAAVADLIR